MDKYDDLAPPEIGARRGMKLRENKGRH